MKALGKEVLTGHQKAWPPAPPEERCGIYYAGYPGIGTRHPSPREAVFGIVRGSGIAHSVGERNVCTQLEREYLMPAKVGEGVPPENFDFRGMSGGLMLTVIQNRLRSWSLAGVIYQGPIHRRMKVKRLLGLKSSVRAALTLFCPMAGLTLNR